MDGILCLALRALAVSIAVIGLCTFSGATYQHFASMSDLERYPPPGRLIDVGGRRLHLLCAGKVPDRTVVIEAGSGNDVTLWQGIVGRVSRSAHVCAYDRAGLGWSDPVPGPRSFDDRARDLHALLQRTDIAGPYILVGRSFGGYVVRRFAAAYPQSVAGIILIDSPDEVRSFAAEGLLDARTIGVREWRRGLASRCGLLRLRTRLFPGRFDPLKGVPDEARGEQMALYSRTSRHLPSPTKWPPTRLRLLKKKSLRMRIPRGYAAGGREPRLKRCCGRRGGLSRMGGGSGTFGLPLDEQRAHRCCQERPHDSVHRARGDCPCDPAASGDSGARTLQVDGLPAFFPRPLRR